MPTTPPSRRPCAVCSSQVAKRYGVVACVTGRRAADARRIVVDRFDRLRRRHGGELLRPGPVQPEVDRALEDWTAAACRSSARGRTRRAQPAARPPGGQELDRRLPLARRARRGRRPRGGGGAGQSGRGGRAVDPLGAQGAGGAPPGADGQGDRNPAPAARGATSAPRCTPATTRPTSTPSRR